MKILLKGYYGFGNLGDDLLMLSSFNFLRKKFPTAEIDIFSNNTANNPSAKYPQGYNEYVEKIIPPVNEVIDWTVRKRYDLIVDGGGGIYFSNENGSLVVILINKIAVLFNSRHLIWLERCLRIIFRRRENLTYSQKVGIGLSIGPYDVKSKNFLKHHIAVNSYNGLLVRDKKSIDYVSNRRILIRSSYDIVFALSFKKQALQKKEEKHVGFVILNWFENNALYVSNILKAADRLEEKGYQITYFSFDENDDQKVIPMLPSEKLKIWDPIKTKLEDFIDEFSRMDIVASMRYHGCVLATCLGIPTIQLALSQKLQQLSTQIPESSIEILPPFSDLIVSNTVEKMSSTLLKYTMRAEGYAESLSDNISGDLNDFWEELIEDGRH